MTISKINSELVDVNKRVDRIRR